MQATAELLDLKPAAIEHIDRLLFDQTRGQREFQAVRDLLELDVKPCEAILIVEFFEDVHDRLAQLEKRKLGLRQLILRTPDGSRPGVGDAQGRAVAADQLQRRRQTRVFVEDTAVRPRDLPAYFDGLQQLMAAAGGAGFLLRPRGGGIAARAAGAGFAQRGGFEKIPADRRRSGGAGAAIQGHLGRRTWRRHRPHRIPQGPGRRRALPAHAGNQAVLRPEQFVQSGQNHFRRPLQN